MDYYIRIQDKEIKLKNIEYFSFDEYNKLFEILNYSFDNIKEQYNLLLELFTDMDLSDIENIKNVYKVDFTEILKQEIKSQKVKVKFNGYELIDLNKITIGRFIDLEYFVKELSAEKRLEKLSALLYLPSVFEEEEFNELVEKIHNKMNIGNALQIIELFISFRVSFYESYSGLFNITNDEEEDDDDDDIIIDPSEEYDYENNINNEADNDEEENKNNIGILEFIYILSGDDYLKVEKLLNSNLYSIMNYLSWMKERNDKVKNKRK